MMICFRILLVVVATRLFFDVLEMGLPMLFDDPNPSGLIFIILFFGFLLVVAIRSLWRNVKIYS